MDISDSRQEPAQYCIYIVRVQLSTSVYMSYIAVFKLLVNDFFLIQHITSEFEANQKP